MSVEIEPTPRRATAGAYLGAASGFLLFAALRWAHHWGPVADSIVLAWALATSGALILSVSALRCRAGSPGLARLGLGFALVSVLALVAAGIAAASGADVSSCGGG